MSGWVVVPGGCGGGGGGGSGGETDNWLLECF